jgi:hypothetical protein
MFTEKRGTLAILGGVLILAILALLYIVFTNKTDDTHSDTQDSSKTEIVDTFKEPSLRFANEELRKSESNTLQQCNDVTLLERKTIYLDDNGSAAIISEGNIEDHPADAVDAFFTIAEEGSLDTEIHTKVRKELMEINCIDFTSQPIFELSTSEFPYPQADNYTIYVLAEGAENALPNLNIIVYGTYNGDIFNLSSSLRTGPDALAYAQAFSETDCINQVDNTECIQEYLETEENLKLAQTKTRELLEIFVIE